MDTLLLISISMCCYFLIAIYGLLMRLDRTHKDMKDIATALVFGEQKILKVLEDISRNYDVKKH